MLRPPDSHYLLAASGWLDLGNVVEAEAELAHIRTEAAEDPDVLEMCWLIAARKKEWGRALETASKLLDADPTRASGWLHRAYALRRAPEGGVAAARESLLPAAEKFPSESVIPYNLACYACQLGQLAEARQWLRKARASGGSGAIKKMALDDPDLEPLWTEIREWR